MFLRFHGYIKKETIVNTRGYNYYTLQRDANDETISVDPAPPPVVDHPIHPPPNFLSTHYDMEKPPPANYTVRALDGVFQVYETAEAAERGEAFDYRYPVLRKYLEDVSKMCAMISNGPL